MICICLLHKGSYLVKKKKESNKNWDTIWFSQDVLIIFALYAGILTPIDEFQYWADVSESAEKNSVGERATHFTEQFKPIQKVCVQTFMCQDWLHERS